MTEDEEDLRNRLVECAERYDGHHYLWGAIGHAEGRVGTQDVHESYHDDEGDGVHGALWCRCAGRHRAVRRSAASVERQEGTGNCGGGGRCKDAHGNLIAEGATIMGESCVGKRHFDCGSFIRYVYREMGIGWDEGARDVVTAPRKGDVCWHDGSPEHVAIFVEGDQTMEAMDHAWGVKHGSMLKDGNPRFTEFRDYIRPYLRAQAAAAEPEAEDATEE
jgi:cell wall-associated NlpC family hydrolase